MHEHLGTPIGHPSHSPPLPLASRDGSQSPNGTSPPCWKGGPVMRDFGAQREGITLDGLVRMLRDGRITRRGFLVRAMGLAGSLAAAEGLLARVAGAQTTTKNTLVVGQSAVTS